MRILSISLLLLCAGCPAKSNLTLKPEVMRGVCYAHTYEDLGQHGYGTPSSEASLDELKKLGVDWVSLTPFGFMKSKTSTTVVLINALPRGPDGKTFEERYQVRGETDEVVIREIRAVHQRQMKVQLKPHIWMMDNGWRGEIEFSDPAQRKNFFASYTQFILHYADMAQKHNVEMLVVGVELDRTTQHPEWLEVIKKVRARYSGKLTYAANWDAYRHSMFWNQLDYVGVQFYPPMAQSAESSEQDILHTIQSELAKVEAYAKSQKRPLLLTELGFRAVKGTAVRPHEWPDPNNKAVDERAQAQAYRALFRALRSSDVQGVFLWKWYTDPNTQEEGPAGFSPRAKQAEAVLGKAFAR